MKKLGFFVFTFTLSFAFLFASCAFFCEDEEVTFFLPTEFDGQSPERFLVLYADGIHQNSRKTAENFLAGEKVSITLSKNCTAAVLAYPITGGTKGKPLGFIYPYSNELQSKNGFASSILYTLYLSSSDNPKQLQDYLARFNWERFMECLLEIEDPWCLDSERILLKIASGKFKKSDLKVKK